MAFGNGPKIVTNGLVDAYCSADKNSYSGAGSTWYSLINKSTSPGNPSWANDITQITIQVWLEKTSAGTGYVNHPINKWNSNYNVNASFILYHFENYQSNDADGFFNWYGYTTNNGWAGITNAYGAYRLSVGQIANIVLQYNVNNGGGQCWLNGAKLNGRVGVTGTLGPTTSATGNIEIYGPSPAGTSKVREVYFYNRELSDDEIIANYNVTKTRYGL